MSEAHDFGVYMYKRTDAGDYITTWRCLNCDLEVTTTAPIPRAKTPPTVNTACGQRCGQPVDNRP